MRHPFATCLTPNTVKHDIYRSDPDFVRAIDVVQSRWTTTGQRYGYLWNTASLLLRPDAIAGGRAASIFPMLREHGILPTVVRAVRLRPPQTAAALWRYQANVATSERLRLLELIMASGPSVYVLVHDARPRTAAPATVHLTYLKGTAIVANRRQRHLRTLAGPPIANILTYVHVSDDPADLLREMAVLFDRATVVGIFAELEACQDRTVEALALIGRLERAVPCGMLGKDADELLRNAIAQAVLDHGRPDGAASEEVLLRRRWREIVERAKKCRSFITGERYDPKDATVPDDKKLSLPLDAALIFSDLGARY
jgi:hypothetical protein